MKFLKTMSLYSSMAVASLVLPGCPGVVVDPACQESEVVDCDKTPPVDPAVKLSAQRTSLRVNETTLLTAWGELPDGQRVDLGTVTFATNDKAIAEVDPATGVITARGTGTTTLTALSAKGQGTLTFEVKGGAVHEGTLTQNETWYARDNPHSMLGTVFVEGNSHPALTLEAGVVVRFANGTGLRIGVNEPGTLRAEGTTDKPIRFEADTQTPTRGFWRAIDFGPQSGTGSKLTHATLSHCGSYHPWAQRQPCISIEGNGSRGGARPVLSDITITHGAGSGVVAGNDGAFGPGSARVSVKDGGDYPFSIQPNYAHTLPQGGTLEGNTSNQVELTGGAVVETQTWPDLGVPYVLSNEVNVAGPSSPVLTLPAGLTLRMVANAAFRIGEDNPGGLQAVGTEQKPITFTAHSAAPTRAFWDGLFFHSEALTTSRLSYAVVEYAGGYSGISDRGNIVVLGDKGPIITHTELRHSGQCGFVRYPVNDQPFPTDFTAAGLYNTFVDMFERNQCGP